MFSLQGVGALFLQTLTDCYLLGQDAQGQVVDASVHMCPPETQGPPGAISADVTLIAPGGPCVSGGHMCTEASTTCP